DGSRRRALPSGTRTTAACASRTLILFSSSSSPASRSRFRAHRALRRRANLASHNLICCHAAPLVASRLHPFQEELHATPVLCPWSRSSPCFLTPCRIGDGGSAGGGKEAARHRDPR